MAKPRDLELLRALATRLVEAGFTVAETDSWGTKMGTRQAIELMKMSTSVQLWHDGLSGGVIISFQKAKGPWVGHAAFDWAEWLGVPLDDPLSISEVVKFVDERLEVLSRKVESSAGADIDAMMDAQKQAEASCAIEATPLVRAVLVQGSLGHRVDDTLVAALALAMHDHQKRNHAFEIDTFLDLHQLVSWGRILMHRLPTAKEFADGIGYLHSRGWLALRATPGPFKMGLYAERVVVPVTNETAELYFGLHERRVEELGRALGEGKQGERLHRLAIWLRTNPLGT